MTERLHFHFDALEKEMATHSSVLDWRIPGTGEPGGLPSLGSWNFGCTSSVLWVCFVFFFFSIEGSSRILRLKWHWIFALPLLSTKCGLLIMRKKYS